MRMSTGTATSAGMPMTRKCLMRAPPMNSMQNMRSATQMVIDMFGSRIISTHMPRPTPTTGRIPRKVGIFS